MKLTQKEILNRIEALSQQRLNLLNLYPVLSVSAMQCLENSDIEGFSLKIDERGELTQQIDSIAAETQSLLAQLDDSYSTVLKKYTQPGAEHQSCPEWCTGLARNFVHTQKLLQNCTLLDAKLLLQAKILHTELHDQLNRTRVQRKIRNGYADKSTKSCGVYINYSSK